MTKDLCTEDAAPVLAVFEAEVPPTEEPTSIALQEALRERITSASADNSHSAQVTGRIKGMEAESVRGKVPAKKMAAEKAAPRRRGRPSSTPTMTLEEIAAMKAGKRHG